MDAFKTLIGIVALLAAGCLVQPPKQVPAFSPHTAPRSVVPKEAVTNRHDYIMCDSWMQPSPLSSPPMTSIPTGKFRTDDKGQIISNSIYFTTEAGKGSVVFAPYVRGGEYVAWARTKPMTNPPAMHNSFRLSVGSETQDVWDTTMPQDANADKLIWRQVTTRGGGTSSNNLRNPYVVTLPAGTTTVTVSGEEDMSGLETFMLTTDRNFNPGKKDYVALAWDYATNANGTLLDPVAGAKIYYGFSSKVYSNVVDVGMVNSTTIQGILGTSVYYFAATAYATSTVTNATIVTRIYSESDFSKELVVTTGDWYPPSVVLAQGTDSDKVNVCFSENVSTQEASAATNYWISGIPALSAGCSGSNVYLSCSVMSTNVAYTLYVANVQDTNGNVMEPSFVTVAPYYPYLVGKLQQSYDLMVARGTVPTATVMRIPAAPGSDLDADGTISAKDAGIMTAYLHARAYSPSPSLSDIQSYYDIFVAVGKFPDATAKRVPSVPGCDYDADGRISQADAAILGDYAQGR